LAPLAELIEEAVGDQLQALLDQLVVDLALLLDLFRRLELRGQAGLELAEADVVEAGGVDVVAGDATPGLATQLDRPGDRPVRVLGVVDGDEDLAVHPHLPLSAGRRWEPPNTLSRRQGTQQPIQSP